MARYRARWLRPDALSDEGEAPDPEPGEHPPAWPRVDDGPALRQLREAEIVACEQVPQGSNYSFAVGLSTTGQDIDLLASYKPRRGEVPLWDFPGGTLHQREYAAYLASIALGWQFIPPPVIRDATYGVGTVQRYVEPRQDPHSVHWRKEQRPALMRIAVFDYVTNNADRKSGHCLLDADGRVWGIDHGLTFNTDPKLRTVIREFGGEPLPAWLMDELRCFLASP